MSAKLIGEVKGVEIDSKRFYLNGAKIEWKCPNCAYQNDIDFSQDYLSYHEANTKIKIDVCCQNCDNDFYVEAMLKLSLEILDGEVKK